MSGAEESFMERENVRWKTQAKEQRNHVKNSSETFKYFINSRKKHGSLHP